MATSSNKPLTKIQSPAPSKKVGKKRPPIQGKSPKQKIDEVLDLFKTNNPPTLIELRCQLEKISQSMSKSPVPEEEFPGSMTIKTTSVMSELSSVQSDIISTDKAPMVECDPFPFRSKENRKILDVNSHHNKRLRYEGKYTDEEVTENKQIFETSREFRKWIRKKFGDVIPNLTDYSKRT